MRVLITGATGFVGQHLVRQLRGRRHSIYGTYLDQPTAPVQGLKLIKCDLRVPQRVESVVVEARPECIYHLAGRSSAAESFTDSHAFYESNFLGTLHLLEAVRKHVPETRILLVGSGQCYGYVPSAHLPVNESEPLRPENPYAVSKAAADILGYQFFRGYGLHVVRTRPFNHTGPGQSPEFVCSNLARQIAAIGLGLQSPLLEVGDMDVQRDFSDVRDIVHAYELLLERGRPGEAYNVGSGRSVPIGRIVHLLTSFCPRPIRISVCGNRLRPGQTQKLYGTNRKLRRTTGWRAEYSLETTLHDL